MTFDRAREAHARDAAPCDSAARDELLELIVRHAILRDSPSERVVLRDSTPALWALDTLSVTLTARGALLAAQCLAPLLDRFDGRLLAAYGVTGIPIMNACVAASAGSRTALIVRKTRREHGARRIVEGPANRDEPVVIVDDSISSGLAMNEAIAHLEAAGFRVEGGVCLVRFSWDRGFANLLARGYHVESVFDVDEDLVPRVDGVPRALLNPTRHAHPLIVRTGESVERTAGSMGRPGRAAEGMVPAHLARLAIEAFLRNGESVGAPATLDAAYEARGGVYVSVRDRSDPRRRHARDGFWVLPGEPDVSAADGVILAAIATARSLPPGADGVRLLSSSTIAVTFFGPMEACDVGSLDDTRHGIVVRSRVRPNVMGGALPRMPGIANAWEQFDHARTNNAALWACEPYELLRHDVARFVEPRGAWPVEGAPTPAATRWFDDPDGAGRVARRAAELLDARRRRIHRSDPGSPLRDIPASVESIFVSLYAGGRMCACMGAPIERDPDDALTRAVDAALTDDRWRKPEDAAAPDAIAVSLLHSPCEWDDVSPEKIARLVRPGSQALMVHQGSRQALLLPQVAAAEGLDRHAFALEVVDKAGITRAPYHWCVYECATWIQPLGALRERTSQTPALAAEPRTVAQLVGGFPRAPGPANPIEAFVSLAPSFADFLARMQRDDGYLFDGFEPLQNARIDVPCDPVRLAHAAWVLHDAATRLASGAESLAWRRVANGALEALARDFDGASPRTDGGGVAAFRLLAMAERATAAASVAESEHDRAFVRAATCALVSRIDRHGRIDTPNADPRVVDALQDYVPGQSLVALARVEALGLAQCPRDTIVRALRYYRHRTRWKPAWGQTVWQAQAAAAWWPMVRDAELAAFAFEQIDERLTHQLESSGAFVGEGSAAAPGALTVVDLEATIAGVQLADAGGDAPRAARYRSACTRACAFVEQLVIQPRDAVVLPTPDWAVGGVRESTAIARVHTDLVQHALAAALAVARVAAR